MNSYFLYFYISLITLRLISVFQFFFFLLEFCVWLNTVVNYPTHSSFITKNLNNLIHNIKTNINTH